MRQSWQLTFGGINPRHGFTGNIQIKGLLISSYTDLSMLGFQCSGLGAGTEAGSLESVVTKYKKGMGTYKKTDSYLQRLQAEEQNLPPPPF